LESSLTQSLRDIAARRGLSLRVEGALARLCLRDAPICVGVNVAGRNAVVRLVGERIRDFIRDIVDSEDEPREYIEEVLDSLTMTAHEVRQVLESMGYNVRFEVKSGVMDIIELLEDELEE